MPAMNPETKLRETLHISRYWANPEIRVAIHRDGIELEIPLAQFCSAVAEEIGSPMLMFKAETLQQKILDASEIVIGRIKEASAHI